jgi:Na+-translocating ferredoxin:NAD+ oxidoreductase RNF subunit RnfB
MSATGPHAGVGVGLECVGRSSDRVTGLEREGGDVVGGVLMLAGAAFAAVVVAVVASPLLRPAGRLPLHPGPVVSAVLDVLPGGNCGACGNESCFDAATAVVSGKAPSSVCVAGGEETANAVSNVLRADRRHQGA